MENTIVRQFKPRRSRISVAKRAVFVRSTPPWQHQVVRRLNSTPSTSASPTATIRPSFIPPPTENSGPLLSRLPNRALPTLRRSYTWLKTIPIFLALITASALGIFNYQKSSSSTVNSILYALRINETARELLGDEIYFASKVPWISGELNQLHGRINISFWVKGRRAKGKVRFVSKRRERNGYFETLEWSLETEDGKVIHLLNDGSNSDPFGKK